MAVDRPAIDQLLELDAPREALLKMAELLVRERAAGEGLKAGATLRSRVMRARQQVEAKCNGKRCIDTPEMQRPAPPTPETRWRDDKPQKDQQFNGFQGNLILDATDAGVVLEGANATPQALHDATQERFPFPPHEERTSTPPQPIQRNSLSARATNAAFDREFDRLFWPQYPHKVGKRKAIESYRAARRRHPLQTILDGLDRYITAKPPDRPWLNPTTFLNQDRCLDQPAPTANRPQQPRRDGSHDALFRALAEAAQDEPSLAERTTGAPGDPGIDE